MFIQALKQALMRGPKETLIRAILWVGILHLIAAFFSFGFYHADEHFQIIEFINYKLGRSPAIDLPLEYGQLMRPWFMSALLWGWTRGLIFLGISSPFDWALSYRILCAGIGFLCTVGLMLNASQWLSSQWQKSAIWTFALIWYLPAFHARHSSENLSGSMFFLGISLLGLALPRDFFSENSTLEKSGNKTGEKTDPQRKNLLSPTASWIIGILFGLAFEFRYQSGFMILGAILWLLIEARISIRTLLNIFGGMMIPIALGTWADHWGYGQWVFAPWNYFKFNLIQNHFSEGEIDPWWDYFRRAFTESWPPLGGLLLLSFLVAWVKHPKHLLTWCTLPLFLVHQFIGHKELRFLFPILSAGPLLLILSLQDLKWIQTRPFRRFVSFCGYGVIGMNGIALIATTITPAWSPIRFYKQLHQLSSNTPGVKLYYQDESLFNLGGAKMNFYKPPHIQLVHIQNYSEFRDAFLASSSQSQKPLLWLFTPRGVFPKELQDLENRCRIEFSTHPQIVGQLIESLNPTHHLADRITNWTLFRCQQNE